MNFSIHADGGLSILFVHGGLFLIALLGQLVVFFDEIPSLVNAVD